MATAAKKVVAAKKAVVKNEPVTLSTFLKKFKRKDRGWGARPGATRSVTLGDASNESYLPCYMQRFHTLPEIIEQADMETYLKLCLKHLGVKNILFISVTAKDPNFKLWTAAFSTIPDAIVVPSKSKMSGKYHVWACIIPKPVEKKVKK